MICNNIGSWWYEFVAKTIGGWQPIVTCTLISSESIIDHNRNEISVPLPTIAELCCRIFHHFLNLRERYADFKSIPYLVKGGKPWIYPTVWISPTGFFIEKCSIESFKASPENWRITLLHISVHRWQIWRPQCHITRLAKFFRISEIQITLCEYDLYNISWS